MTTVLFILFAVYIFLFLAGVYGWWATPSANGYPHSNIQRKISIIIPARNEQEHIATLLDSILANDYPQDKIEIMVVDDHSEDDTAAIVQRYHLRYPFIKLISLAAHLDEHTKHNSFKKLALSIAIAQSSGELILQTDADCIVSKHWIPSINAAFDKDKVQIVAAPVDLLPIKGGWGKQVLYWFQSLDFLTMQGITAATHYYHIGAMANGANVCYRRTAFEAVGGFRDIQDKATGDDMMLMQKVLQHFPESSLFLKEKEAIVRTVAPDNVDAFLKQRIRWSAKAAHYEDKRLTAILALVYLFNLALLILSVVAIFLPHYWIDVMILWGVKTVVELLMVIPLCGFFNKNYQVFIFPLLQPLHILYIVVSGFFGANGTYQWKGRKVK